MIVRLRRLPALPLVLGGAVTGFVAGLFLGCLVGALLAWFSGAVLDWHRQLGFTLGVTEELLPLGEQIGLLQAVRDDWWLVVPACGLLVGLLNAIVGTLSAALVAGILNRLHEGIWLEIEVPEAAASPAALPAAEAAGQAPARPRVARRSEEG